MAKKNIKKKENQEEPITKCDQSNELVAKCDRLDDVVEISSAGHSGTGTLSADSTNPANFTAGGGYG